METWTGNLVEMSVIDMCLYLGVLKELFEPEWTDLRRPMCGRKIDPGVTILPQFLAMILAAKML